jgi:twinkle protein
MKTFHDYQIDLGGRSGVEVQTTCPQCSASRRKSKARCLSVNTLEGLWICHHCDWRGALKTGEEARSTPPRRIVRPSFTRPSHVSQSLREWFHARGISDAVLERYGIAEETVYMPQLEAEALCIVFPYARGNEIINLKYRAFSTKAFRQVKDAEKILYGLDDLTEGWAVMVEGECDKLALAMVGISNAVSVPDGAPPAGSKSSEAKFEYLTTCAPQLDSLKKIILAVDRDPPGQTLEAELARRLGPERCWRVTWPDDCKDANEVLMQHGAERLRACIEEAKPYPLEGVFQVADLASDVMTLYREGLQGGCSTGWLSLDRHYTVRPGELTIVTGIPSHGKSQFLDALVVNLAKEHDWTIAVCSPENLPVSRHIAKLIEQYTGKPFREGPSERVSPFDLAHALQWLHEHFVFLATEEALTITALLEQGKALVTRHGIRGLIIDPWNEFEHTRPANQTETEYISASLGKIRRFGRAHGVHVWVVAHPQKLYRGENGNYPVPSPYDISGSAHWRNKADNCLTVWRDEKNPGSPVQIHIQKVRFKEVGKPGGAALQFNPVAGRYSDVPAASNYEEASR